MKGRASLSGGIHLFFSHSNGYKPTDPSHIMLMMQTWMTGGHGGIRAEAEQALLWTQVNTKKILDHLRVSK